MSGPFTSAVTTLASTALGVVQTRIELLSTEWEEERARLGRVWIAISLALFFTGLATVLVVALRAPLRACSRITKRTVCDRRPAPFARNQECCAYLAPNPQEFTTSRKFLINSPRRKRWKRRKTNGP